MRRKKLDYEKIILNGIVIIANVVTPHACVLIRAIKEKGTKERHPELQCSMNSCRLFRDLK